MFRQLYDFGGARSGKYRAGGEHVDEEVMLATARRVALRHVRLTRSVRCSGRNIGGVACAQKLWLVYRSDIQ